MPQINAVIATARAATQMQAMRALASVPGLQVRGQAGDLSGTYVLVEQQNPKLVLLGAELVQNPEFDGLIALFRAMEIRWMQLGMHAAPGGRTDTAVLDLAATTEQISAQISAAVSQPAAAAIPSRPKPVALGTRARADRYILIGSSTGGIDALLRVLSVFPADCPPTAIVQHTGAAFSDSLIRLLDRSCAAAVVPARSGLVMQPGQVILGAGCQGHLRLAAGSPPRATVQPGEPVSGHLPSVDELFHSAVGFGPQVVAAILTGMGKDGAQGMLALRRAGACTIAQDEATSVIYGMPRAAWEIGGAEMQLPIDRIGPELLARIADRTAATRPAEMQQR